MKTSRLTDKHFNSRNVQRLHKTLTAEQWIPKPIVDLGGMLFGLWIFLAGFGMLLGTPLLLLTHDDKGRCLFFESCHVCYFAELMLMPMPFLYFGLLMFVVLHLIVSGITRFVILALETMFSFYTGKDEMILINPDGNPEMCKIKDYPAIDFYGYRLPNAGDIGKIALFEEQRQKQEERAEKERQDKYLSNLLDRQCVLDYIKNIKQGANNDHKNLPNCPVFGCSLDFI
jgi:hypothetical protein